MAEQAGGAGRSRDPHLALPPTGEGRVGATPPLEGPRSRGRGGEVGLSAALSPVRRGGRCRGAVCREAPVPGAARDEARVAVCEHDCGKEMRRNRW